MANSAENLDKPLKSSNKSRLTRATLEELSKEALIDHVLRLEANNFQLKNILRKYLANNKDQDKDHDLREQYTALIDDHRKGEGDQTAASSSRDDGVQRTKPAKKPRTFDFGR